jgi:hypothetical protein
MADEGAAAASLPEEEGILPLANQPPEAQNAPRGRNRGSFAQKILLAGPELWLQGTEEAEVRAVCNQNAKLRGKVVQVPRSTPIVIPNYTVQWYSSGTSGLHMNQLSTVFTPTPANKRLLLSAIAAYEESETRPRQRRHLSTSSPGDTSHGVSQQMISQRSSQRQQSSAAAGLIVAARQETRHAAVSDTTRHTNGESQLSESDDESVLTQQSQEEQLDEFESAYNNDDTDVNDNQLDGISFNGDNMNVPQDVLPNELIFSWDTLAPDFQRPDNLPEPQYYNGETGLKRGIASVFETPLQCFMRVSGADVAFWWRVTANSNKYARQNCTAVNCVPYFAGSEWNDIRVQEMIRAHGIILGISFVSHGHLVDIILTFVRVHFPFK